MRALAPPGECPYCDAYRDPWALIIAPAIASRSSITLAELLGDILHKPNSRSNALRAGACLRSLGWLPRQTRSAKAREWRFYPAPISSVLNTSP
jgi:hypothetical protein